jgi:hypothetical protein
VPCIARLRSLLKLQNRKPPATWSESDAIQLLCPLWRPLACASHHSNTMWCPPRPHPQTTTFLIYNSPTQFKQQPCGLPPTPLAVVHTFRRPSSTLVNMQRNHTLRPAVHPSNYETMSGQAAYINQRLSLQHFHSADARTMAVGPVGPQQYQNNLRLCTTSMQYAHSLEGREIERRQATLPDFSSTSCGPGAQ